MLLLIIVQGTAAMFLDLDSFKLDTGAISELPDTTECSHFHLLLT